MLGSICRIEAICATKNNKYLFSRNVFAFETFFPIAEAFHEK
jgi:hypothetical protein